MKNTSLITPSKNSVFIQWFIVFCACMSGGIIAFNKGLIGLMIKNDQSYICLIVMSLFIIASLFAGRLAYTFNKLKQNAIKKKMELLVFFSENFFTLGLLGTIIGFCIMMYTSLGGSAPDVNQVIVSLRAGLATAFYTTLVGIVCSLFLQLQMFVINRCNE